MPATDLRTDSLSMSFQTRSLSWSALITRLASNFFGRMMRADGETRI
jgi:hypothetical protein